MHTIWRVPKPPQPVKGHPFPYEQALTDFTLDRTTPSTGFSIALTPLRQGGPSTIDLVAPAVALITCLPTGAKAIRAYDDENHIEHFAMFKPFLLGCDDEKLLIPER